MATAPLLDLHTWVPILDGDADGRAVYERHYPAEERLRRRQERGTLLFVGPGFKLVLMTPCRRALFVWRRERFRADDQVGVNCAVFRNEGAGISSELVRDADAIADERFGRQRHFTFVDPAKILSTNPGYCFIMAGWRRCGVTERGLVILERPA